MYSYCFTAAPSGANVGALRCKLAKDSDSEYLICLKRHCIDVYSLEHENSDTCADVDIYEPPALVATINFYATLVTFMEYRPPGSRQSHLLVLESNYTLLLLTYDSASNGFKTRVVASLKENSSPPIASRPILRVDDKYNLILFHGNRRIIKCIVLSNEDYFHFTDVVSLHTMDAVVLDVAFISAQYSTMGSNHSMSSSSSSSSSSRRSDGIGSRDTAAPKPTTATLDCNLVFLMQELHTGRGDQADVGLGVGAVSRAPPKRFLDGQHLYFEMEIFQGSRRFTSYACTSFFGNVVTCSLPFSILVPINLNPISAGALLIGSGGIGYMPYKDYKSISIFHLDDSISNVNCACMINDNAFLIGDDCSNFWVLRLFTTKTTSTGGLKRRVKSTNSAPVQTTTSTSVLVISNVTASKVGSFSVANDLIKLSQDYFYVSSAIENSFTLKVSLTDAYSNGDGDGNMDIDGASTSPVSASPSSSVSSATSSPLKPQQDLAKGFSWGATNLGPIVDFTFGPENQVGDFSIIAACGIGSSGKVVSLSLGIGLTDDASVHLPGVTGLDSVVIGKGSSAICLFYCSFYKSTRFFRLLPGTRYFKTRDTLLDRKANGARVSRFTCPELREDCKTLKMSLISPNVIVHVTTVFVHLLRVRPTSDFNNNYNGRGSIADASASLQFKLLATLSVHDMVSSISTSGLADFSIILADITGDKVVLVLSDNTIVVVALSYDANGVITVDSFLQLSKHISAIATLEASYLAVATWEDSCIYVGSLVHLNAVSNNRHQVRVDVGVAILAMEFGTVKRHNYMFVACSDGKLLIYTILLSDNVTLHLENAIQASTSGPIGLTCIASKFAINVASSGIFGKGRNQRNLRLSNIVTTGKNSMVIYSHLDKLAYNSCVSNLSLICNLPFPPCDSHRVNILYYTSDEYLHIGSMDTEERLQVKPIVSGRTFDHVCYHKGTDIAVVGCPGEMLVESTWQQQQTGQSQQAHDGSTSKAPDERLDEDGNAIDVMCLDVNDPLVGESFGGSQMPPVARFINAKSLEVIYDLQIPSNHVVSSCCSATLDGVEYIAIGTSKVLDSDHAPTHGFIYLVELTKSTTSGNNQKDDKQVVTMKIQSTRVSFSGGVVALYCTHNHLIAAINHTVISLRLSDVITAQSCHKLEHMYASDAKEHPPKYLSKSGKYLSNTFVVALDGYNDVVLVADLMTSVRLLKIDDKGNLFEIARNFSYLWPTSCAMLDANTCLTSDADGYFTLFSKTTRVTREVDALSMDARGKFKHGEMVNQMRLLSTKSGLKKGRSRKHLNGANDHENFDSVDKLGIVVESCRRDFCTCNTVVSSGNGKGLAGHRSRSWSSVFSKVILCATSNGALIQVCLFDDEALFIRLALVEEAMKTLDAVNNYAAVAVTTTPTASITGYTSDEQSGDVVNVGVAVNVGAADVSKNGHGFINGDIVERVLHLEPELKLQLYRRISDYKEIGYTSMEHMMFELSQLVRIRTI